jgi:hypothetical protein
MIDLVGWVSGETTATTGQDKILSDRPDRNSRMHDGRRYLRVRNDARSLTNVFGTILAYRQKAKPGDVMSVNLGKNCSRSQLLFRIVSSGAPSPDALHGDVCRLE